MKGAIYNLNHFLFQIFNLKSIFVIYLVLVRIYYFTKIYITDFICRTKLRIISIYPISIDLSMNTDSSTCVCWYNNISHDSYVYRYSIFQHIAAHVPFLYVQFSIMKLAVTKANDKGYTIITNIVNESVANSEPLYLPYIKKYVHIIVCNENFYTYITQTENGKKFDLQSKYLLFYYLTTT